MGTVLIFGMNVFKSAQIVELCRTLGLETKLVSREQESMPLGALLGLSGVQADQKRKSEPVAEEMLVFHGIEDATMNALLKQLRTQGLGVALKSVVTPTNVRWTAQQLFAEVRREHEAFAKINY